MRVRLKVFRYDPENDERPYYLSYEVEAAPEDRLLDCLNRIRWEQDPTLSFRMSCGHGICGSDGMRIDGICGLPCRKLVKAHKDEVLIEPLPVFPVIKDLVVDLAPFFERYRSMKPYLITRRPAPLQERTQSPEAQAVLADAVRCILCGCCTASCPVNQAEETADYTGPAALVRAFRYLFDSRDEGAQERIALLDTRQGAWGCRTLWKCTEVCPRQIPVTKQIGRIKARIFDARKKEEKG
jgi:succinate dehydrogenase / fumarate reductase iron-sulfur subunit